jgi:hypothetical protein
MDVRKRGNITEAKVLTKLIEEDIPVFTPFADGEKADLVIKIDNELYAVQVKTAWEISNGEKIRFNTSSTSYNGSGEFVEESYKDHVDVFIVYSPEKETYLWVDVEDSPSKKMGIRFSEPEVNNPNINWYEDYLLNRKI